MGKITVGKYAGFCFGVRRSVDRVYELAEKFKGCRLFTTGELIHNPSTVSYTHLDVYKRQPFDCTVHCPVPPYNYFDIQI